MQLQASFPSFSLQEIAEQIFSSRRMTRQDQSRLMSLLFDNGLKDQEQNLINHLYDAVQKGMIRLVD